MKNLIYFLVSTLIVVLLSLGFSTSNLASEVNKDVDKGLKVVKELESQDLDSIQNSIDEYKSQLQAKNNANETIGGGSTKDYKMIFKDDVFLGDSQTEGLAAYSFLNENSVVAEKGKTVVKAMDDINTLKYLSPDRIYMLFGLNDMLNYLNISDFINDYGKLIDLIKEELPDTEIYVQSIMPARADIISKQPLYSIPRNTEANDKLQELCEDKGASYIDIKSIIEGNSSLYEPDGIHVNAQFYKLWLEKVSNIK